MSPLPEIAFAIPRNPILAVGIPLALGFASGAGLDKLFGNTELGPDGKRVPPQQSIWFKTLRKPYGNPPNWVFAPVWSAFYAGMGYASHLCVRAFDTAVTPAATAKADYALQLYYAQLGLNLIWSPLFFGARQMTVALGDILALTGLVIKMTVEMGELADYTPISTNWFLVPYCAWLSYATYLNASYVYRNWNAKGNKIAP